MYFLNDYCITRTCSTEKVKSMDLDRRKCILFDENFEETAPHIKMEAFEEYRAVSQSAECVGRIGLDGRLKRKI